jgi:hypothetical protein
MEVLRLILEHPFATFLLFLGVCGIIEAMKK